MKARFSIIVGLAAGWLVGVTATAQAQFNYEIHDGTVTTTRYTGPGGDVVIPDTIDGRPVTNIGGAAFYDCTGLTSITIPDSVTSIGWSAFSECSGLRGVYFEGPRPSSGSGVFSEAPKVISYYLPGQPGWSSSFGGRPTAIWKPQVLAGDGSFGSRSARLWDLNSGRLLRTFGPTNFIGAVAFSPDGKQVLTGGAGGAQLWDLATAQVIREFGSNEEAVKSVAFSVDGVRLAMGSSTHVVQVWETEIGTYQ